MKYIKTYEIIDRKNENQKFWIVQCKYFFEICDFLKVDSKLVHNWKSLPKNKDKSLINNYIKLNNKAIICYEKLWYGGNSWGWGTYEEFSWFVDHDYEFLGEIKKVDGKIILDTFLIDIKKYNL